MPKKIEFQKNTEYPVDLKFRGMPDVELNWILKPYRNIDCGC